MAYVKRLFTVLMCLILLISQFPQTGRNWTETAEAAGVSSVSVTNKGILYGYKSDGSTGNYNMHGVFTTPKYRAYCGEHSIPEPVTEGNTKTLSATKYSNAKMVKILYYGYGGPGTDWSGFASSTYNSVYNTAEASTSKTMACGIAVTAMAVHSVYTGQGEGNWYKPSGWEEFNKFINSKSTVKGYSAYKLEGGSGKQDLFTIMPHEYTIKYHANGGSGTMATTSATYDQSATLRANSFSRTGYTFKGWATSSSGSVAYSNKASVKNLTATDGGTVNLYAVWAPKSYTLTFNANGGKLSNPGNNLYNGSNQNSVPVTFNSGNYAGMAGDIPTRSGYTFTGWYLSDMKTQIYGSNGMVINDGKYWKNGKWNYAGNLTVYAKWTAQPVYTLDVVNGILDGVNKDGLDGFGSCDVWINGVKVADDVTDHYSAYPAGTTYEINDIKAKSGYAYVGPFNFSLSGTMNSHVLGWLQYKTTNYTITFNPNGGTLRNPGGNLYNGTNTNAVPVTLGSGSYFGMGGDIPTRSGYTFNGWYLSDMTTKIYDASGLAVNDGKYWSGGVWAYSGNLTVYAKWTALPYYTLDVVNGILDGTNTDTLEELGSCDVWINGVKVADDVTDHYAQYITGTKYEINDIKTKSGYTYLGNKNFSLSGTMTSNVIGWLQYKSNTYSITFNPNGGALRNPGGNLYNGTNTNSVPVTFGKGSYFGMGGDIPTRKGYTFNGWYLSDLKTKIYDANGLAVNDGKYWSGGKWAYAGNLTVYAGWTPKSYTLTFNANGGTLKNPGSNLYNGTNTNSVPVTFGSTNYYRMSGDIPTRKGYTFTGWYLSGMKTQIYGANGNVVNEGTYWSSNKWNYDGNLTVYAGWTPKSYTLTFNPNGGTLKNPGSNLYNGTNQNAVPVTFGSNSYYAMGGDIPTRSGYTFTGWYLSNQKTKIYNAKGMAANEGTYWSSNKWNYDGNLTVYAGWNAKPTISVKDNSVLTFMEGEKVTKDDLIANIVAKDKEDDAAGKSLDIRIIKIEYAEGKIVSGKKQSAYSQSWSSDVPSGFTLDTWFMSLDKADSPVTHKVTYAVTDSYGNTTTFQWKVQIKYNEFPIIEAHDEYYSLDDAQAGKIKLADILKEVHAWDAEDCKGHCPDGTAAGNNCLDADAPCTFTTENLEVLGFDENVFLNYTEPGYEVVTYKIVDAYGKEAIRQATIYIMDDGQLPEGPSHGKEVRFISKKNYEKNASVSSSDLTLDELNAMNDQAAYQTGGLRIGSLWYEDDAYASALTSIWADDAAPVEQWIFSRADTDAVREFVKNYGSGNSKQADGLVQFRSQFGGNLE